MKSAARVLELLAYFAEQRRSLATFEIVRGLGYPQSSASALLTCLTKAGFLDYDRHSRRYMPTLRVALLGQSVHDELYSSMSLFRLVDWLHEASGESVGLAMQNGIHVQYVHLVQDLSAPMERWYVRPGSLRSICRTAMGKILLSRMADSEVLTLTRRSNAEEPDIDRRVDSSELLNELAQIRQRGYAYSEAVVNPDRGVVAMELPIHAGHRPMAIGIGAEIAKLRANRDRYVELLNQALQPYRGRVVRHTLAD